MNKSPLRKLEFKLLRDALSDERFPSLKKLHKIRFLSRGLAVSAIVANYQFLLTFFRTQGGKLAVTAANSRLQEKEDALHSELTQIRANLNGMYQMQDKVRVDRDAALEMLGPESPQQSAEEIEMRNGIIAQCETGALCSGNG